MATSFVGCNGGGGSTTITVATHQPGDLIIIWVLYSSTLTPPAGWTFIANGNYGSGFHVDAYYKIATSTSDTSGTWTGSDGIIASFVYRQDTPGPPTAAAANGNGTVATYPDLTGHSAYLRVAYTTASGGGAPSGWESRTIGGLQVAADALTATTAATVGGNTTALTSWNNWTAWTIGLSPTGNPGQFFQFF